jgi:hypothetical protein
MLTVLSSMIVGHSSSFMSDIIWSNYGPNSSVVLSNVSFSTERPSSLSEQRQLLSGDEPSWKMISGGGTHCEILNGCVQDLKGAAYGGTSWECSFEVSGAATIYQEEWGVEYEPSCSYDYLEMTSQGEGTTRYCGAFGSNKSFPYSLSVASGKTTSFTFHSNGMGDSGGVGFKLCLLSNGGIGAKFIVAGGSQVSKKSMMSSAEQYDPVTNKWTAVASMTTERNFAARAILGGKFIVVGGSGYEGGVSLALPYAEQYDPITNKWTSIASMNTGRSSAAGAALAGKFILAGYTIATKESCVVQYDPVTNKWKTTPSSMTTTSRYYAVGAVYFINCPPGTSLGDTGCLECRPGTFQVEAGQPTCTKCPSSRYHALTKQTNVSSCKPCPAGKFGSSPGQVSCVACKVGQHQQHAAQSSCINCRSGRFQNRTGQPTCDQCRDGQFAAVDGRTDCGTCEGLQGCSVGEFDTCGTSISKFASGGICLSCPPGNTVV